uniref:Uncharacterized protein n=1 Tax=Arundo donax TaxID=35708 RepID=A0A0A9AWJ8_ARUDO
MLCVILRRDPFENGCKLSIWILNDYGGEQWDLKHTFNLQEMFGIHYISFDRCFLRRVIATHPECM